MKVLIITKIFPNCGWWPNDLGSNAGQREDVDHLFP